MTVHLMPLLLVFAKLIGIGIWALFSFLIFCWPINDKPTTKLQYAMWIVSVIVIALLAFNVIQVEWQ